MNKNSFFAEAKGQLVGRYAEVAPLFPVGELRCQSPPTAPPAETVHRADANLKHGLSNAGQFREQIQSKPAFVETVARFSQQFKQSIHSETAPAR